MACRGVASQMSMWRRGGGYTPGPRVFGPPPRTIIFVFELLGTFPEEKMSKMKKKPFCNGLHWCVLPHLHYPLAAWIFFNFSKLLSCRCHMCSRATTEHICKSSNLILCVQSVFVMVILLKKPAKVDTCQCPIGILTTSNSLAYLEFKKTLKT